MEDVDVLALGRCGSLASSADHCWGTLVICFTLFLFPTASLESANEGHQYQFHTRQKISYYVKSHSLYTHAEKSLFSFWSTTKVGYTWWVHLWKKIRVLSQVALEPHESSYEILTTWVQQYLFSWLLEALVNTSGVSHSQGTAWQFN